MEKTTIVIPEGTLRSKIAYLLETHPDLSRMEMAELLDKTVATIYSYVSEIKKSAKKKAITQSKKRTVNKVEPQTLKTETQHMKVDSEVVTKVHPPHTEKVEVKPSKKSPDTLEFSLVGVNGEQLQLLLFNLLSNSVSDDEEYSFMLTLEKAQPLPF